MVEALVSDHLGLAFYVVAYGRFDCISPKMAAPQAMFGHSSKARHDFSPISQPLLQDLFCAISISIPTSKTSTERPRKVDLLPIKQNCKHQQQTTKCCAHNGGYKFGGYVCGENVSLQWDNTITVPSNRHSNEWLILALCTVYTTKLQQLLHQFRKNVKSAYVLRAQWPEYEYFYSPLNGMLVHRRVAPQHQICRYPFEHMGRERDCESKVSCPGTQRNVLGQGSNPNLSIRSQVC